MADITITSSAVLVTATTVVQQGTFGEAVDAGEGVYLDTSVSPPLWKLADNTTAAKANAGGIALNSGATGQPASIATLGTLTLDGLTLGTFYYVSTTPGKLCPYADISSTDYITQVIGSISTTSARVQPIALGVQLP